jgi:hypothetical protein
MAPEGRQSPPPERQTGEQVAPATQNPNMSEKPSTRTKQEGKDTLANLESNPEHILAKSSEEKTSKKNYIH